MKFDWKNWDVGGKIIFISTCAAALSMFLPWVDIGIARENGFEQGAIIFLALFIYPFITLLKNNEMKKLWGYISSIGALLVSIGYYSSKDVTIFGRNVNATAEGAYIFYFASIALIFGVVKYIKFKKQNNKNTSENTNDKIETGSDDNKEKLLWK